VAGYGGRREGAGRKVGSKNKRRKQDGDYISWEVLRSIDSVALSLRVTGSRLRIRDTANWKGVRNCSSPTPR
jgi:hypothetical protein